MQWFTWSKMHVSAKLGRIQQNSVESGGKWKVSSYSLGIIKWCKIQNSKRVLKMSRIMLNWIPKYTATEDLKENVFFFLELLIVGLRLNIICKALKSFSEWVCALCGQKRWLVFFRSYTSKLDLWTNTKHFEE